MSDKSESILLLKGCKSTEKYEFIDGTEFVILTNFCEGPFKLLGLKFS
jgi:hypothetical protein